MESRGAIGRAELIAKVLATVIVLFVLAVSPAAAGPCSSGGCPDGGAMCDLWSCHVAEDDGEATDCFYGCDNGCYGYYDMSDGSHSEYCPRSGGGGGLWQAE